MCLNKRTFSLVVFDDPQKGLNDFNVGQLKNSLFTSYSSCINYKLSIEIMVVHTLNLLISIGKSACLQIKYQEFTKNRVKYGYHMFFDDVVHFEYWFCDYKICFLLIQCCLLEYKKLSSFCNMVCLLYQQKTH